MHVPSGRVRGAGTGLEPAWDMFRRGSPLWLPAGVMFGLPRWHAPSGADAAQTPATSISTARERRGLPLNSRISCAASRTPRVQSYAIALRSPASERLRSYTNNFTRISPTRDLSSRFSAYDVQFPVLGTAARARHEFITSLSSSSLPDRHFGPPLPRRPSPQAP